MPTPSIVSAALIREQAFGISIPEGQTYDAALEALAAKAQRRLYRQDRSIDARLSNQTLDSELVQDVIVDMTLRIVRNPNAYRSVSIDDFQATIDQAVSSGALYATADELALLAGPATRGRSRSMSLGLSRHRLPGVR